MVHFAFYSLIPYINANHSKLLPLPVVTNAAGLLGDVSSRVLRLCCPTDAQCQYLNELCASAGLEFTFDTTTLMVDIAIMCSLTTPRPYVRELPSRDPFSHAQFIDESLVAGSTSTTSAQSWHTTNSFITRDVLVANSVQGVPVSRPADDVLSTLPPSQVSW